ncbi:MAG: hypothetical protein GXW97_03310, partial [Methanothermobacter sp.]|nr:hypothetical protein [Methanothermobacter sp.]
KTHDVEEAFEIAGELMDRIHRAHDSGGDGSDSRDMSRIGPMDVHSCLPLKEPWLQEKVQCLEKLLGEEMMETLGWSGY